MASQDHPANNHPKNTKLYLLEELMNTLASKPDAFDECKSICLSKLIDFKNENTLESALCAIFDKCVMEPKLNCTSARLCSYISNNLGAIFEQLLLEKCREESEKSDAVLLSDEPRLRGLAYFYSQLFVSGTERLLGESVCRFLSLLLDLPTEENLMCISQVLNSCGAAMKKIFQSNYATEEKCFQKVLRKILEVVNDESNNTRRREAIVRRSQGMKNKMQFLSQYSVHMLSNESGVPEEMDPYSTYLGMDIAGYDIADRVSDEGML